MKNTKKKYYWKVVYKDPKGKFISAVELYNPVTYFLNKRVTSPTETGLFCFKTRSQARQFKNYLLSSDGEYQLMKVDVDINSECDIKKFSYYMGLPTGTILFSEVTPFEISH
jgi:hypothetical protein